MAHAEQSDIHDYVLALYTHTLRPHVHLTVQAEGLDRTRLNPRPVRLNRCRERFARELRARGVAAEATPRRARGQGVAGSSMALIKLRARLASRASRVMTNSDQRTNEQAIAVARGQAQLPPFIARGKTRWQQVCGAYEKAAAALDAPGPADDKALAGDVRGFLDKHPDVNATPEIFAARHSCNLATVRSTPAPPAPEPSPRDRGRRHRRAARLLNRVTHPRHRKVRSPFAVSSGES